MIAVQAVYENGKIFLAEKAPMNRAEVIVIFPEEDYVKKEDPNGDTITKNKDSRLCVKEESRTYSYNAKMSLFNEFTGSIKHNIEERKERLIALDKKYESTD